MSKRFTDTDKWNDVWFRNLTPHQKLLWNYYCDNCNLAGFLELDDEKISFDTKLTAGDILGAKEGLKRGLFVSNEWIWIKNFLRHQRNLPLNPQNAAHKHIIEKIRDQHSRFSLKDIEEYLGAEKGLLSPTGKGNSKGKGIGKGKEGGTGETNIEVRKQEFINSVNSFKEYPESTLTAFCEYWTEHNEGGLKMRFEMEKVFDKARRLKTWTSKQNKFSKPSPISIGEVKVYGQ